jgi:arsenical pump membrane protein
VLRWYFRRDLRCAIPREQRPTRLTGNGRLVLIGIVLIAVVLLAASAMKKDLGLPACLCSVFVSCIVLARARTNPIRILRDISWSVLPLVAGLFILVEAIDSIGAMRLSAAAMQWAERLPAITGALLTAGLVGVGSNIVNNLPLGLIAGSTLKLTQAHGLIANVVLITVDLGPNLSVTGSLATILWLIALRREGVHVDFKDFLKVGVLAMPIALTLAIAGAVLVNAL